MSRTDADLQASPCNFKIKEIVAESNTPVGKVRKLVPKKDENGNQVYKTIDVPVKQGGCSCKNKNAGQTTMVKQQVAETVEVWEDGPSTETKKVFCKIYGQVKGSYCQGCRTYKNG